MDRRNILLFVTIMRITYIKPEGFFYAQKINYEIIKKYIYIDFVYKEISISGLSTVYFLFLIVFSLLSKICLPSMIHLITIKFINNF